MLEPRVNNSQQLPEDPILDSPEVPDPHNGESNSDGIGKDAVGVGSCNDDSYDDWRRFNTFSED